MKIPHHITHLVTAGVIAGALAAPAASARPAPLDPEVPAGSGPVLSEGPAPVVQSVDEGFDWASAAIGVGGTGALILLIGAGGSTYRRRHDHPGVAR